jgi:hypothetical protein
VVVCQVGKSLVPLLGVAEGAEVSGRSAAETHGTFSDVVDEVASSRYPARGHERDSRVALSYVLYGEVDDYVALMDVC